MIVWNNLDERKTLHEVNFAGNNATARSLGQVVAALDATQRTRELLLDSFMQGFLYRLFEEKWSKYRVLYVTRLVLDVLVLIHGEINSAFC